MLVSATIRGTLPAAAELLDGAFHVLLFHANLPGPAGAIALEPTPASLLAIAAQRLPKDLCLGAAFLLGQAFRFSDQVRGKGEHADSCGGHSAFLD
jgi:hypothetical protein